LSQSILKQTVKNSFFSTAGLIATLIIKILFAGFLIRLLGVEQAGFLILLDSVMGITGTVGGFGFGTAALRKISIFYKNNEINNIHKTFSAVQFLNILVGLSIASGIIIAYDIIFKFSKMPDSYYAEGYAATIIFGIIFLIRQVFSAYNLIFSAIQRYDVIAIVNSIISFLTAAIGFLVLILFPRMSVWALFNLFVTLINFFVCMIITKRLINGIPIPKWNFAELKSMAGFGFWTYLTTLSVLLFRGMDKVVLTSFLGSSSLPYYSIGQQIVEQIHGLLTGQSQFLFPMLASGEGAEAQSVIERIEDRLRWFIAFISSVIYCGFAVIAFPVLSILISPEFAAIATLPFQIACLQGFLHSQAISSFHISWAEGKGAPNAIYSVLVGILCIISTVLLVPKFGVIGASLGQLWVGILSFLLFYMTTNSNGRFSIWNMFRPLITPYIIVLFWFGVCFGINYEFNTSELVYVGLCCLVGAISIVFGLIVEKTVFEKFRCLSTLYLAMNIFFNLVVKRSHDYQKAS
jgi:O-antigen/teichoic acid export membrane protein